MPNSMKVMIKKLAHKGCISSAERDELLAKLDGHDEQIRADERAKAIEEFARRLNLKFVELPLDDLIVSDILKEINRVVEQMKGDKE